MTLVANGNCRYTLPEGDAAVSPAGVMVIRHMVGADDDTVGANDRGRYHLIVGLPKQAAPHGRRPGRHLELLGHGPRQPRPPLAAAP